jgi:group I intron endonuclease
MFKSGIYKITSPTGKIYIGQAVDIDKRWSEYNPNNQNLQKQCKIYRSLIKYGIDNHKFEIVEECNIEKLNEREIYWGEYYNVLGENGLNLRLGGANGKLSEEVKIKISEGMKEIKRSEETKEKHRKPKTKEHSDNIKKGLTGLKRSESTLVNMSNALKGKKLGRKSIGSGRKAGFKVSEETKQKQRLAKLGKPSNHKKQI